MQNIQRKQLRKEPEEDEEDRQEKTEEWKEDLQTSPSQVIPRKGTPAGTQESRHQTQAPAHGAEDPKSRAHKSFDQLAREYVDGNQKIARELGLLAPEHNSCKPRYLE
jgi:hypothetical protein